MKVQGLFAEQRGRGIDTWVPSLKRQHLMELWGQLWYCCQFNA